MPNVIASATTVANGSIKKNNFVIGVDTSIGYGPTSATTFWNGIIPPTSGYTVYAQKSVGGPSIRVANNDSELITIAQQYSGTNINTINDALSYLNSQSNFLVANIDYPSIVTSGMVLNLDAGYVPSYPKTGTTWSDLSGNNNNGTLVNGPTFNSANGGTIVFDGTDDYAPLTTQIFYNTSNPEFTLSFICKPNASTIQRLYSEGGSSLGRLFFGINASGVIDLGIGNSTLADGTITPSPNLTLNINEWVALTVTNKNNTTVFYKNGVVWSTNTHSIQSSSPINAGESRIGRQYGGNGEYFSGSIPIAQIYNRALSPSEVLQNYDALKSRFGL